jgi:hypothetical protein
MACGNVFILREKCLSTVVCSRGAPPLFPKNYIRSGAGARLGVWDEKV